MVLELFLTALVQRRVALAVVRVVLLVAMVVEVVLVNLALPVFSVTLESLCTSVPSVEAVLSTGPPDLLEEDGE